MVNAMNHAAKAELLGIHITPGWSDGEAFESMVRQNAERVGVELTDEHWKAIRWVANVYAEHGETPPLRLLAETLEHHFAKEGGRKRLYQLFPNGPIRQICELAELPVPAHASDGSFGYSF